MTRKSTLYTLLVGQIFLWTGSAFISVLYRLLDFYAPERVTFYTEVLYYAAQAAGIGLFAVLLRHRPGFSGGRGIALASLALTAACTAAALLAQGGAAVMAFGLLMNIGIGMLSGIYLTRLASHIPQQCRGRVFGYSYAIGSIGTWLLSLLDGGELLRSGIAVYVFLGMAALSVALVRLLEPLAQTQGEPRVELARPDGRLVWIALFVPLLCSLVNGLGYFFSTADVSTVLNPAFTRIFYAVGLIAAGILNDTNRRYGAACCITALIFPFVSIALRGEVGISAILCVFSYIFYGFFSVYRVVLFADIAGKRASLLYMAAFGLLAGRIGDAAGTFGGMALAGRQLLLTCAAAGLFVVCAMLFFALYHRLYMPVLAEKENVEALLGRYEMRYRFTSRQSEIFRMVARGCSNAEISAALFLSESTVKFHMKNILRVTGCKNRTELIAAYRAGESL